MAQPFLSGSVATGRYCHVALSCLISTLAPILPAAILQEITSVRVPEHPGLAALAGEQAFLLVEPGEKPAVILYDTMMGAVVGRFEGHTGAITRIRMLPKRDRFATASADKSIRVWDLTNRRIIKSFVGHSAAVTDVTVTPDLHYLISCGLDGVASVWDLKTFKAAGTFKPADSPKPVRALVCLGAGEQIASAGDDGLVRFWNRTKTEETRTIGPQAGPISALAVAAVEPPLGLAGDAAGGLSLWRGEQVRALKKQDSPVTALAMTPDGTWAFSGHADGRVLIWDCATGEQIGQDDGSGKDYPVVTLDILPDGKKLLVGAKGVHRLCAPSP